MIELLRLRNEELQVIACIVALAGKRVHPPLLFHVTIGGQRGRINAEFLKKLQCRLEIGGRWSLQLFPETSD